MKVDFTDDTVFSFEGPNLCFLGNEGDFRKLSGIVADLTNHLRPQSIDISNLDFIHKEGKAGRIIFMSEKGANLFGIFDERGDLYFRLDHRIWERLFKYFVLMSWNKSTYYLNIYENCLDDLELFQECNFICSSGF